MRHALLEVARTEWSTSASSWRQGRSTPAVVVDSEGLKDGRHQCFEVGPICVDLFRRRQRWKLIRRLAGRRYADSPVYQICCVERWNLIRRYADSPVYQSVVLNVGIWYAGTADSPVYQSVVLNVGIWYAGTADSPVYQSVVLNVGIWYAGTPIRRYTNLLCWTLESDTPIDGSRFACVRRFAGVPICCVERWNLIRRLMVIDSPAYADLPVYQSVVLNVGIWYADWW